MKITLLTLGCKVNQAETLQWEHSLALHGHHLVGLDEDPDLCLINTCTVTSRSDYESRQLIRRAEKAGAKVMVTGCYAELNRDDILKMDGVEQVIANTEKDKIINMIPSQDKQQERAVPSAGSMRARKIVKVQDGCNYSCTYCLVWKARGRSRSVPPDTVVNTVKMAVDEGYSEVVLTGVHLGLYGQDLESNDGLSALVEGLITKTDVERIRLSSLEINEIDERLIELMSGPRVCRHLHIPLQSGSDTVLKDMNRQYSRDLFRERVLEITERTGDIALGTDIIAGFPTETQKEFENSCQLARELPFTYMHVFPYSPRPGTAASRMKDIVSGTEKKERAAMLRDIAKQKKADYLKRQVGEVLPMLVERSSSNGQYTGTSDNYIKISAPIPSATKGSIVQIRIARIQGDTAFGNPA